MPTNLVAVRGGWRGWVSFVGGVSAPTLSVQTCSKGVGAEAPPTKDLPQKTEP
ncbi:DUF6053 domain-containing protein [Lysobacter sp. CA199]|uniref:DUF6053 domain-containing protein n=1 Tax=Lysobacter sp. CA199 TaxID=3455608 RepID=UPI003F8D3165